jgi:two-component system phosphate regulon sensor histidine kinase PhoR
VTLTQRLVSGSLAVVGLLMLLTVGIVGGRLRARLEGVTTAQLAGEARLLAAQWDRAAEPDALADASHVALGHRVTFIDSAGRVVGDSEFSGSALARLDNHATRPEFMEAIASGAGVARRVSASTGAEQLYVAVRAPYGVARVSMPTGQLDATVARARRDVLVSGLTALLVAAALAYVFSRAVSRPIVELRDTARALAAGDLTRRPALAAPGEVGELARALHGMSEQLASRLSALQAEDELLSALLESLNEGVIAIDARRQVIRINESGRRLLDLRDPVPFPADRLPRDRTLREALAGALTGVPSEPAEVYVAGKTLALTARPLAHGGAMLALLDLTAVRRLEAIRRDFVANVSHELKTPLTVISGFAETLAEDELAPEQRARFADAILTNARRMQRIVDDLLDLSRIESGGWVPEPTMVDVDAALTDALTPCQPRAAERQLTLQTAVDPRAKAVYADPTALRQVVSNLVENALRYTNPGGAVTVFTRPDEWGVWIGVRDTGIGISADHLARIFERFYRADPARSRDEGGTGLGLSIVRHLVEAHGGRVAAESAVGRGTTVTALFPNPPTPRSAEPSSRYAGVS